MMQPPLDFGLTIIIVTYNSAPVLSGLLDSLPAGLEGVKQFQTIVVDNDSHDNSVDIALVHPTRPRVIRMGRNAGYAAAINAGAASVSPGADLLILNPDVRLFPGAASLLLDRLTDLSVGVAVPRILEANGTISWTIRREPSVGASWAEAVLGGTLAARLGAGEMVRNPAVYDREGRIDWATGAILAVSGRVRTIVGDWDEILLSVHGRGRLYAEGPRMRIFGGVRPRCASDPHWGRGPRKPPPLGAIVRQSNSVPPQASRSNINSRIEAGYYPGGRNPRPPRITCAPSRDASGA